MIAKFSEIYNDAAKAAGLSPMWARVEEGNVLLDTIDEYPVIIRPFAETIRIREASALRFERNIVVYVCDNVGNVDARTMDEVAPIVDAMLSKFRTFVEQLRLRNIDVEVGDINPQLSHFDAIEAGVYANITLTYNGCGNG